MHELLNPDTIHETCREGDLLLFHFKGGGLMPGFYRGKSTECIPYAHISDILDEGDNRLRWKTSGHHFRPNGISSFFTDMDPENLKVVGYEIVRRAEQTKQLNPITRLGGDMPSDHYP